MRLRVFAAALSCAVFARGHDVPAKRGSQREHGRLSPEVKVSLSATGTITKESTGSRGGLMRRDHAQEDDDLGEEEMEEIKDLADGDDDDEESRDNGGSSESGDGDGESEAIGSEDEKATVACDSGGETWPRRPRTFQVEAPTQVPFTLSLRMRWTGDDPPDLTPNPACVICWTIDPDTRPSTDKAQFFQGLDGQPPRIALMRMGNVLTYEEYGANGGTGTANLFTSETVLNDQEFHEVVLVRGEARITLWIDGKPDVFITRAAQGNNFQSVKLPKGKPNGITGKASTANEYLRRQVANTQSYNKVDPNNGKWSLKGEVTNVRLYYTELSANDFPNSKVACEATTTTAPATCHSTCSRCDGASEGDCLSCKARRFLHERKCLEQCPDGYFGNSETKSCEECHESCATCSGNEDKDCQGCASDSVLHKGRCMSACPVHHYADANGACVNLAGSVVALKTMGQKGTSFVFSNSSDCVKLMPLDEEELKNPREVDDEAKMWMISDTGKGEVSLRNVKTGMALHMLSQRLSQTKDSGCSETVASCAVARPPSPVLGQSALWTDAQWASNKCQKSTFTVVSAGSSTIGLGIGQRYLRFHEKTLTMSEEMESSEPELTKSMRFEPVIVMPAVSAKILTSGRCKQPITQSLQCSAAAGGQALDAFADFTEQRTDTSKPPGCYYYQHEIPAPEGGEEGYDNLPETVSRLVLNVLDDDSKADYSSFADCSAKMPCLCKAQ